MDQRVSRRVGIKTGISMLVAASTLIVPTATATPSNIAGMVVFIDPGHNGANDASIGRQVTTGRGGTKDCQTSGTATNSGYQEHTFTWDTALRVRAALTALGVRTALSRGNDNALGPCIDERANVANSLRPNAILSIHADGGPPSGRGFHVNYSAPPLNQVQAGPSVQYARIMRDQMQAAGIPPSTYIGQGGLYGRSDLTGLNLAQYPAILVECGNMKNPVDSALMESADGRQKYADALVRGVAGFLATQGQAR
ncbi:MAG: Rv3717 family N-acetylmuramoyl-L-alanine amidase [Actinomycetota bacterium]|uniref:Rv3717 family N-acetylmuramoyl-L-alanine amidase n=2 Tax=Mycobacterium lentiflavum TaxID=141349 RepID=A0ABY3UUB7_MYCLN|nr:Rv3717 family N-acetylmuramoyl-L-alanine amidase [Mycobacterium lentiflavum]MEE3065113.1 Rv3717 family N-acetylmuramoyl-L-alanine amidase [Actinomycetota bacterium]ULP42219.1 Rv3717 family N-acetylmuramoyl-L-alanine amidase [Mycobacterium lentiflavum]